MNEPDQDQDVDTEGTVTFLLNRAQEGDGVAADELFTQLQGEMRRTAAQMMRKQPSGHTLQPTAIVNEAMVRLLQGDIVSNAMNRRYLFAAANKAMSRALIDHARKRQADKRPTSRQRTAMDHVLDSLQERSKIEFRDLAEALACLRETSPRQAEVTELRFFSGLDNDQIAEVLDVSTTTVKRDWTLARAKLFRTLNPEGPEADGSA